MDVLSPTKSKDVDLIVRVISFQDFQLTVCDPDPPTLQTDGQTDERTTFNRNTVRCTTVHRAVKMNMTFVVDTSVDLLHAHINYV